MLDDDDLDFVAAHTPVALESFHHVSYDVVLDLVAAETPAVLESSHHPQQLDEIDL